MTPSEEVERSSRGDSLRGICLVGRFCDEAVEERNAAFADRAVAAGEALDRETSQGAGAGQGQRFGPHHESRKGEVPGSPTADSEAADADKRIAGEEGAVALVEKAEMAGDVTGGRDDAERAEELAFGHDVGDRGDDAGQAAMKGLLRLVGGEESYRLAF